jgi:hypothetical protein
MPTYTPLGIGVRLGSVPLEETISSNVVLKKGQVAREQSEAAQEKLLSSPYLPEIRAPLQVGDWQGIRLAGVPFLPVQAGHRFAHDSLSQSSDPDGNHQEALALHVKLSENSFDASKGKSHLKTEVLFNGQLSACSTIHAARNGDPSLHQIFAGYRVDYLAERPWVLLPPTTTADRGTRTSRVAMLSSARWDELCAAILTEAEDRGTNQHGDQPPSARFLRALASTRPPPCIVNLQKPGGKTFGVVDVIITAGDGWKPYDVRSYLTRPTKLSDPSYTLRPQVDLARGTTSNLKVGTTSSLKVGTSGEDKPPLHNKPTKKRVTFAFDTGVPQHASPSANLRRQDSQETVCPPPYQDLFSIPDQTNSNRPAPEQRSDDYMQPLSPTNPQRIYDTTSTSTELQPWGGDDPVLSQDYDFLSLTSTSTSTEMQPGEGDNPVLSQSYGSSNLTSSVPRPPHMPSDGSISIRKCPFGPEGLLFSIDGGLSNPDRNPGSNSMPGNRNTGFASMPRGPLLPADSGLSTPNCNAEFTPMPGGHDLPADGRLSIPNRNPGFNSMPGDPTLPARYGNPGFNSMPGGPTLPAGNGNRNPGSNSMPGGPTWPARNGNAGSTSMPGDSTLPVGNTGSCLMPGDAFLPVTGGLPVSNPGSTSMPGDMAPNIDGTHTPKQWDYSYGFEPYMPPTPTTVASRSMPPGASSLPYDHYPQPFAEHSTMDTYYSGTASYGDTDDFSTPDPQVGPFFGHPGAVDSFVLPPTAMFSVPTKPRRSVSPTRSIRTVSSSGSSDELLINRLVIMGQGGATVLDHSWKTPQRIRVGQKLQARPNLDYFDIAQIDTELLGSKQISEGNAPRPYLNRHQAPADEIIPENPCIDVPDELTPLLPAPVSTNHGPTLTADSEDGATADGIDVPEDLAPYLLAPSRTMQVTLPALFLLPR